MKVYEINIEKNKKDEEVYNYLQKNVTNKNVTLYYGYPFINLDNTSTDMKYIIICNSAICILYNTGEEKKIFNRFINININKSAILYDLVLENPDVINYISYTDLSKAVELINDNRIIISDEEVKEFNAVIQKSFGLTKKDERIIKKENSLGDLIKKRNNSINMYDVDQFKMIYDKSNKNLRIRGLAGSGKTILLAKKMAYLHFLNPNLKMVYVFYTLSLKQFVQKLFLIFYKDFDKINEPNLKNVLFLHSWGGMKAQGFYSYICNKYNIEPKTVGDVKGVKDKFGHVCNELLSDLNTIGDTPLFDKIFVDEAQDFSLDFFKLARKVLYKSGNLIYAYDELQSLNEYNSKFPTKKEIFENDECYDINLSNCYRTPNKLLVTAHALGLGVYNYSGGKIKWSNMIRDLDTWNGIGYKNETGEIKYEKEVVLYRESVIDNEYDDPISFKIVNRNDQYKFIIDTIKELFQKEDVVPEDILIIDLDQLCVNDNFQTFRHMIYNTDDENDEFIHSINTHIVNKENAVSFNVKNSIPYTTIFRAKGNEANIVFIINADSLNSLQSYNRNKIFTALTRSKFKAFVLGKEPIKKYIEEYEFVKQNKYKLVFKYPSETELNELKIIADKENQDAVLYENAVNTFKKMNNTEELLKQFLYLQAEKNNIMDIQEYIKQLFGDNSE